MTTRHIPISEVGGWIRRVEWASGVTVLTLFFNCPMCDGHHVHGIPFRPEGGTIRWGGKPHNVWTHEAGSTVDDLTLAPSYLSHSQRGTGGTCRLHVFVRQGVIQVLTDSRRPTS